MSNALRTLMFLLTIAIGLRPGAAQTQPSAQSTAQLEPAAPMTADELPDAALHGDLLAVIVLDLQTGDKTAWNNAILVITGGKATTRPLGDNDPLPMGVDGALGPFFKMGAQRIVISVAANNGNTDVILSLRLREGADENAATQWLRRNARANTKFTHDGPWLITRLGANNGRPVTTPFPLSPQADDIRQELNCCGNDMPIKVVYLTSDPVKRQMTQGDPPPQAIEPLLDLFWTAKYLYFGGKLGAEPGIELRWAAPDEPGADAVIKELEATHQRLKAPNVNLPVPLSFLGPALDQCHPVRQGAVARISLDTRALQNIFTGILVAQMARQNSNGQQGVTQTPVAPNWAPIDPATDAAAAQMRLILAAIAEYDRENHALPATLDDLLTARLVPGPEIFHDPRTNTDNGFTYSPPQKAKQFSDIPTPEKTPILYEQKNGQPDPQGLIGYANGTIKLPK